METETNNLPVPVTTREELPAVADPTGGVLDAKEMAFLCTSVLHGEEDRLKVMQCWLGEVPEARYAKEGTVIECETIIGGFTKEIEEESGEMRRLRKFVFVAPDGTALSCSGKAMPDIVRMAMATFKQGPWSPPVLFRVRFKPNDPPKNPTVFLDPIGRKVAAGKQAAKK